MRGKTTMSDVIKRCTCPKAGHNKCPHPWYMSPFRFGKRLYRDNVTRWALVHLGERIATRTRADEVVVLMRTRIHSGAYVSVKVTAQRQPPTPGQRFERVIGRASAATRAAILQLLSDCEASQS